MFCNIARLWLSGALLAMGCAFNTLADPGGERDAAATVRDGGFRGRSVDGGVPDARRPDASPPGRDAAPSAAAPTATPSLRTAAGICKLLSDRNSSQPTANDVQHRANILGADLGIPVDVAGRLFVFFGDTIGYRGIWPGGESHPDAVGYALDPAAAVAADPSLLCRDLRFLVVPGGSALGPTLDPSIQSDFAGLYMTAPEGHSLGEFIHNPAGGSSTFAHVPGDFEVPSGAFAHEGAAYVFYTTVTSRNEPDMKASYLARWSAPSPDAQPGLEILYAVDQRFDGAGALRGDFVNIAAQPTSDYVYLFGTGQYRASAVHLARKRLASLESAGDIERWDHATRTWLPAGSSAVAAPVVDALGYGELSVRYFPGLDRWMMLGVEYSTRAPRAIARFADRPEGPWQSVVVHDLADPSFQRAYCCAREDDCEGAQFLSCRRTGFYGGYLLPDAVLHPDGSFTVAYILSSFSPYGVELFSATFAP